MDWLFDFDQPGLAKAVLREIAKHHPEAAGLLAEAANLIGEHEATNAAE